MRPVIHALTESRLLLARSRQMSLPSGASLRTPLLVPSVSSRAFGFTSAGLSEAAREVTIAKNHLTESLLVSAYDLHHRLLPDVDKLLSNDHWASVYSIPQLLVVDSGGYELRSGGDAAQPVRGPNASQEFTEAHYANVVARLPTDRDVLLVTYDYVPGSNYPAYDQQVAGAARLLNEQPQFMIDFLAKPQPYEEFIAPTALASATASLRDIDVIGVTDTELGDSILDRLLTIAQLREALDEADVEAPLHVFGVLSLLHVGLYFMVGAEVFDGLDWFRYGNHMGMAVERETTALLKGWTQEPSYRRQALATLDYLDGLGDLKHRLCRWVESGGDFSVMGQWRNVYEDTYAAILARLSTEG